MPAGASDVLDALADPTRRAVFELVASGPLSVTAIAAQLPVSRPAVSQHLKVLRTAQLVRSQQSGRHQIYAMDRRGLSIARRYFDQFWTDALDSFTHVADAAADQESQP